MDTTSGSLGTLEEAVPQAQTPSWMPQAKTPRWRWRQPSATHWSQQRRRATGPDAMLEAAAELLRGVKQQSRNTRKRDAKFKLEAQTPTWRSTKPCQRLRRQAACHRPADAKLEQKQLVAAEAPCQRPRRHAGSCSGTFEGGQAAVSED